MDEKEKALKISSKVIAVLMRICYIAMIVVMCASVAVLIFMAVSDGKTAVETSGGTNIVIMDGVDAAPEKIIFICIELFIMAASLFAIFIMAYRMFKETSITGNPFNARNVKTIKIIGILVVATSFFKGIADSIAVSCIGVESPGAYLEAPGFFVGVLIFCLAYIFDYGCSLKK